MTINSNEKKPGIIFDLDGTLWDACAGIAAAWTEYLRLYEPEWYEKDVRISEQTVRGACGKTMDLFTAALLHELPEEEQKRLYGPCCSYEVKYLAKQGAVIYPDVVRTLKHLSGTYRLFIISNCQEGYIQAFLTFSGLEAYVEDTEDYGTTGLDKDENIRLLAARNHLEQAVYVGDTAGDYEKTRQAGLPFIFAAYGFGELAETVKVPRIRNITQLPDVLANFWN